MIECLLAVILADSKWFVAVARCKPKNVATFLVDFYRFVEGMDGVKSLHFIIRDRIGGDVVLSFRILAGVETKKEVKSKIAYKLRTLLPKERFAIDPGNENSLFRYAAWPTQRTAEIGEERFSVFCDFLSKLSKIVVEMAERKHFDSSERIELAHVVASMLGCTEYGLLTKNLMEVGYYDRIVDKYCTYLKEEFPKS